MKLALLFLGNVACAGEVILLSVWAAFDACAVPYHLEDWDGVQ